VSARDDRAAQRSLARDERTYDRRVSVYLDAIDFAEGQKATLHRWLDPGLVVGKTDRKILFRADPPTGLPHGYAPSARPKHSRPSRKPRSWPSRKRPYSLTMPVENSSWRTRTPIGRGICAATTVSRPNSSVLKTPFITRWVSGGRSSRRRTAARRCVPADVWSPLHTWPEVSAPPPCRLRRERGETGGDQAGFLDCRLGVFLQVALPARRSAGMPTRFLAHDQEGQLERVGEAELRELAGCSHGRDHVPALDRLLEDAVGMALRGRSCSFLAAGSSFDSRDSSV